MKIKHHYIFTETNFKPSRTYGGGNYTLAVWKVEGVGKLRRIGTASACTRAHKGQDHEAWSQCVQADLPPALLKKIRKVPMPNSSGPMHYIPGNIKEFGVWIQEIR